MALQITGTIIQKCEPEVGETKGGQPWIKQQIVMVYGEEFERNAAFILFGEQKVGQVKDVNIGDRVRISFSLVSTQGKSEATSGKWFTEANAYKVENLSSSYQTAPQQQYQQPQQQRSAPPISRAENTKPVQSVQQPQVDPKGGQLDMSDDNDLIF